MSRLITRPGIEELRERIRRLEGASGRRRLVLPFGIKEIDRQPVTVRGFFLGHPEFAAKRAQAVVQAAEMIVSDRLHIPVAGTYPLSSIKEAITHAQRGGKILLDVAGSRSFSPTVPMR